MQPNHMSTFGMQQPGQKGGYSHPHANGGWLVLPQHPGAMQPNTGIEQARQLGMLYPLTEAGLPMNPNIAALGNPEFSKAAQGSRSGSITNNNHFQELESD